MADEPLKNEKDLDREDKVEEKGEDTGSNNDDRPSGRSRRPPQQQQRQQQQQRRRSGYRRGYTRRKVCAFCAEKERIINWKEADRLRRYVNDSGSIRSRRKTGTCAKHQRRLAIAIKRARHMSMLPYTVEHVRIMGKG